MKIDRLLFTAPQSAGGKTMVTCGILAALGEMGKKAVSFKCGPDYISPESSRNRCLEFGSFSDSGFGTQIPAGPPCQRRRSGCDRGRHGVL